MTFLVAVLGLIVVGLIGAVALAGVLAVRNKKAFESSSRLAPGLSTGAPAAWAGSHDPEAKLHRRLRDAVVALTANQAFDFDGNLIDLRVEMEHQAMALDEQLVATAALPVSVRREPLSRIAEAVGVFELAVADLADTSAAEAASRLSRVLDDVRTRTGLVAQARAALDALDQQPGEVAPPIGDETPQATGPGPTTPAAGTEPTQPSTSPPKDQPEN